MATSSALAIFVGVGSLLAMLAVSIRLGRALHQFDKVPVHFDIKGRPDAFGSKGLIIWLMPGIYVAFCVVFVLVGQLRGLEPELVAELYRAIPFVGLVQLSGHLFIAWLLMRWRRSV